jgi:hypothetical protein
MTDKFKDTENDHKKYTTLQTSERGSQLQIIKINRSCWRVMVPARDGLFIMAYAIRNLGTKQL